MKNTKIFSSETALMHDEENAIRAKILGNEPVNPETHYSGLTKREYFAIMVLNGYMIGYAKEIEIPFKMAVSKSVMLADCLLEELSKT